MLRRRVTPYNAVIVMVVIWRGNLVGVWMIYGGTVVSFCNKRERRDAAMQGGMGISRCSE
jgi:hypothetical protein